MRENCQSGSMSGNRKQSQAKPDCGDTTKVQSTTTGRLPPLRLFSTLLALVLKNSVQRRVFRQGSFFRFLFFLAQSVSYAVAIAACALMLRNRTSRFRFCAAAKREGSPSARYAGSPDICQKCPIGSPAAGRVSISTADLRQSLARLSATQKLAILTLW